MPAVAQYALVCRSGAATYRDFQEPSLLVGALSNPAFAFDHQKAPGGPIVHGGEGEALGASGSMPKRPIRSRWVPSPQWGEGNTAVEAPSFRAGRTSTHWRSVVLDGACGMQGTRGEMAHPQQRRRSVPHPQPVGPAAAAAQRAGGAPGGAGKALVSSGEAPAGRWPGGTTQGWVPQSWWKRPLNFPILPAQILPPCPRYNKYGWPVEKVV